jgi:hypothetical protein
MIRPSTHTATTNTNPQWEPSIPLRICHVRFHLACIPSWFFDIYLHQLFRTLQLMDEIYKLLVTDYGFGRNGQPVQGTRLIY